MTQVQIRQILEEMLGNFTGKRYWQMKQNGEAELYLNTLLGEVMAAIQESRQQILNSPLPHLPIERAQYLGLHFRAAATAELQNAMTKMRGRPAVPENEEPKYPWYLDLPNPIYISFADGFKPKSKEYRDWSNWVEDRNATFWLLRAIKMSYLPKKPERCFIITSLVTRAFKRSALQLRAICTRE